MSHEIETLGSTRESASFASARVHAWHGLGVVLPSAFDAMDAMRFAKLGGAHLPAEQGELAGKREGIGVGVLKRV